ncbi:MAG: hypothetical protein EXS10_08685 [Phycisphaerales bacterium]|nr:hypothetical protein [Phycisphaerales bacterium]
MSVMLARFAANLAFLTLFALLVGAYSARTASAGELQEYCRLRGLEANQFAGIGLVTGLEDSGDSMKDASGTAQSLAGLLAKELSIRSDVKSLAKVKSVALVSVTLDIPTTGARSGDRFDIRVSAVGTATSLARGQLHASPLKLPFEPPVGIAWLPYAVGSGQIEVDPTNPRIGVIRGGAQMVRDVLQNPIEGDAITLIIAPQYAGYATASSLADLVNDELSLSGYSDCARVIDQGAITVRIPQIALPEANAFIARLMTFTVPGDLVRTPARVVIDRANEVITVDDRVEFRPAAVTAGTLRITTMSPPPQPSVDAPMTDTVAWAGIATSESGRNSMKLRSLLDALIELDVPFSTQVAVLRSLKTQGAMKAEIIEQ